MFQKDPKLDMERLCLAQYLSRCQAPSGSKWQPSLLHIQEGSTVICTGNDFHDDLISGSRKYPS